MSYAHSVHPLVRPQFFDMELDTIICGDNCEVMRQWPAESIDLVVTSPPYDDLREYGKHAWDFYGVAWNLARLLKPGGVIVWNVADATKDGSETGTSMMQALHFRTLGLNLHDTMIYAKTNPMPKNDCRYEPAWEYVFVVSKGKPHAWNPLKVASVAAGQTRKGHQYAASGELKKKWGDAIPVKEFRVKSNVWEYAVGGDREVGGEHPAIFPAQFAKDHIASWSNLGDVVLDPFAGSGTTLKAAKELNRHFIGIEK
jgi:DNA modification methylase